MKRLAPIAFGIALGPLVGLALAWGPLSASWNNVSLNGWLDQGLTRLAALALKSPLQLWFKLSAAATVLTWLVLAAGTRRALRVPGRPAVWVALAVLLVTPLVLANVWASLRARVAPAASPNVVWIVIDALRADHLSCYGYPKDTSPFIDSIAAGGFRFERAISQESYTLASAASYFTSKYPPATQVFYDRPDMDALDFRFATIAEVLKNAGYDTAAFVFNPHLQARFNFAQGFDLYDDSHPWYREKDPTPRHERWETGKKMLAKLEPYLAQQANRPVFLYLHYRDVHGPYLPPPPYHETFLPPGYEPQVDILYHLGEELDHQREHVELFLSQYDGEIRYTDEYLRHAFDLLGEHGIDLDSTIVVITSDHGEEFLEPHPEDPAGFSHGRTLFIEQLHVPLIVHVPGLGPGRSIETFVELIDIGPTVLEAAGIEPRAELGFQGRSLLPGMQGRPLEPRPVYAGGNRGRGVVIADDRFLYRWERDVKLNKAKFHDRPEAVEGARHGEDLYYLRDDPAQLRDLAKPGADEPTELRALLAEWLGQERASAGVVRAVDAQTREALNALGYAGDDGLTGRGDDPDED